MCQAFQTGSAGVHIHAFVACNAFVPTDPFDGANRTNVFANGASPAFRMSFGIGYSSDWRICQNGTHTDGTAQFMCNEQVVFANPAYSGQHRNGFMR
jgi:hypothetical protein